nr:CDP-alcohol phosphatidyltransferase family protein [Angustibacter aerolatus]
MSAADLSQSTLRAGRSWEPITTWANLVTGVRTVAALVLGVDAIVQQSGRLLLIAYLTYWIGDILDGAVARLLHQETRIGAVFDIVSDRACSAVLVCGLVLHEPRLWPALVVYLAQFMVLDCAITLSFLRWPIVSPNYFYEVDRTVFRWNWSKPAKAINNVGVVVFVVSGLLWVALAVALAQAAVKVWTAHRVLRSTWPRTPGERARRHAGRGGRRRLRLGAAAVRARRGRRHGRCGVDVRSGGRGAGRAVRGAGADRRQDRAVRAWPAADVGCVGARAASTSR